MTQKYIKKILRAKVYDVAEESPLDFAPALSARYKNQIFLKREDLQAVFSFKLRGAYNKIVSLSEQAKQQGVIAASAGNHAQGVALSAKKLAIKSLIVMPKTTPEIKVKSVRALGAKVVLYGEAFDDENYLARVAKRRASFEAMNSAETEPTSTLGVVPAQFQGETLEENNTNIGLQSPGVDTMSTANNTVIGGVPVSTVGGGFSPNTINTSQGIYGNAFERQRAFKKPLIKLT